MAAATSHGPLRKAWQSAHPGKLSALSQARLWAAREVWRPTHDSDWGLQAFAAQLVTGEGTTESREDHPTQGAVAKFYQRVDEALASE